MIDDPWTMDIGRLTMINDDRSNITGGLINLE